MCSSMIWRFGMVLSFLVQDEVAAAEKSIDEKTTQLISKGRWMVPGYKVRCDGSLSSIRVTNFLCRRSSATSPSCNRALPTIPRLPLVYSSIVDTTNSRRQLPVLLICTLMNHVEANAVSVGNVCVGEQSILTVMLDVCDVTTVPCGE